MLSSTLVTVFLSVTPKTRAGLVNSALTWEDEVYIIAERQGKGSLIYKVKSECRKGPGRVLHCNLLEPCDAINLSQDTSSVAPTSGTSVAESTEEDEDDTWQIIKEHIREKGTEANNEKLSETDKFPPSDIKRPYTR